MRICLLLTAILSLSLTGCGKNAEPPRPASPPPAPAIAPTGVSPAPLIASWHFVGVTSLNSDTNASVLRSILALPATAEFRDSTMQQLARAPFRLLRSRLAETTNDFSELLRPLLDDLLTAESFVEIRGVSNKTPELVLAIRLTDERTKLWNSTLATVLQAWTGIPTTQDESGVWELKKHHSPNLLRVARTGEWLVLGAGDNQIATFDAMLAQIKSAGRPIEVATGYWFSATADWPRLATWLNLPPPGFLPPGIVEINVLGEGENLRVKGKLTTTRPLDWKPEAWTIPTNLIQEPLISFTAGQGIAGQLAHRRMFSEFQVPPPNQFYAWALANIPFQTFAAFPIKDVSNTLARVAPRLVADYRTNRSAMWGSMNYIATNNLITWSGLPFVTPFVQAVRDDTGEFIFGGLFPNNPSKMPLPAELLDRLHNRTNLVYYDWEITGERMLQWRNLNQLAQIAAGQDLVAPDNPIQPWLKAISQKVGNAITEITVTAPSELTLNRKSPVGLTGIELLMLVEWLHSEQFPHGHTPWSPTTSGAPAPAVPHP